MSTFLPSDLEEDEFLAGPDRFSVCKDASLLFDVHPCFAKAMSSILEDARTDRILEASGAPSTPSLLAAGYCFVEVDGGVLLMSPLQETVGAYVGCDIAIEPSHRGKGLGAELVLEYALRRECLPVWDHDKPAYSPAGLAAHRAAWRLSHDRGAMMRKLSILRPSLPEALQA